MLTIKPTPEGPNHTCGRLDCWGERKYKRHTGDIKHFKQTDLYSENLAKKASPVMHMHRLSDSHVVPYTPLTVVRLQARETL